MRKIFGDNRRSIDICVFSDEMKLLFDALSMFKSFLPLFNDEEYAIHVFKDFINVIVREILFVHFEFIKMFH